MTNPLRPPVKTTIKGEGTVVYHDETRYGLRRICVASYDKYPDLEIWCGLLNDANLLRHRYVEKVTASVWIGYLWIYYKQGR
jgi:hypothetical protein